MYFFSNIEIIFCQITSFHIISHQLIAVEVLPMLHGDEMTHTLKKIQPAVFRILV